MQTKVDRYTCDRCKGTGDFNENSVPDDWWNLNGKDYCPSCTELIFWVLGGGGYEPSGWVSRTGAKYSPHKPQTHIDEWYPVFGMVNAFDKSQFADKMLVETDGL